MKPDGTGKSDKTRALTVVALALILAASLLAWKMLSVPESMLEAGGRWLTGWMAPSARIETLIVNTIGEFRKESKWVVLTQEITVCQRKKSSKTVLAGWVDLGDTVVELWACGNKVQYAIDTTRLSRSDVRWVPAARELVVTMPRPVLDEGLVEVQSDPAKLIVTRQIGWGRLQCRSGEYLEREIRRELRERVIQEGRAGLIQERACQAAEENIRRIAGRIMKELGLDGSVRVVLI